VTPVLLERGGVAVVLDVGTGAPTVLHWGRTLGAGSDLAGSAAALGRPVPGGSLDAVAALSMVPEHGSGFPGHPGLVGRRADGTAWAPRFSTVSWQCTDAAVTVDAADSVAGLGLRTEVTLSPDGVLGGRVALTNHGPHEYLLDELTVTLALPAHAVELVTFDGRWCREFHPRRRSWDTGAIVVEHRRGRTSHDQLPLVWAGTSGFGEQTGEVWGVHLAWSGNAVVRAEAMAADGRRYVQAGELLHPGEVELAPGATHTTPWVLASYAEAGLTPASQRFHRYVRARPVHPRSARPVVCNTWEAVYFDHDRDRLWALAQRAAAVGAERFVLDDGWFGGRRSDRAGLGDWVVSPNAHPDGLGPLIDHVRTLGMEFGIWVEPEMVNPDSELYRAHPDWVLATPGYPPVTGRHQLVVDLARADAYAEVRDRLDALLGDHAIAFVKWDMNRDHAQGSGASGRAGSRAQTLAVYRLLDELRARHPGVEFESCASGGGRIDLGILERAERVWTSDCNDPFERQVIQRWATTLLPPELLGVHVGPPRAHTTGRHAPLAFRVVTALFGQFGIEWDLLGCDDGELAALAEAVALHKRLRPLLHGGDVVRFDRPDPHALAHGVLGADRSRAVVALVQLTTAPSLVPAPLRIAGLDPDRRYRVLPVALPGRVPGIGAAPGVEPRWMTGGVTLTGAQLAAHGLQPPVLGPGSCLLVEIESWDGDRPGRGGSHQGEAG
jgi:alpha-galactosidase